MLTDKNALSIEESIGWKNLVGQVKLPKLSCELSGSNLIQTLLEFNLTQDVEFCQRKKKTLTGKAQPMGAKSDPAHL
jgi:hypothetical protein